MIQPRQPLSKKTRFDVFKRDLFCCQYCGQHPPSVLLEIDHVVPVVEGGTNARENLLTACFDCNRGKGKNSLSVVPQSLSDRAVEVAEREKQLKGYRKIMTARAKRIYDDSWEVVDVLYPDNNGTIQRGWFLSIKRFVEKLPVHQLKNAAELTWTQKPRLSEYNRFLYFCGICWKWIKAGEPE